MTDRPTNLSGQRDAVAIVAARLDGDRDRLGALVDGITNVDELRSLVQGLIRLGAVLATVAAKATSDATGELVEPRVALQKFAEMLAAQDE